MIRGGGTERGTRCTQNNTQRTYEHSIGSQQHISRFFRHWQSTLFGFCFASTKSSLIPNSPAPQKVSRVLPAKSRIVK
jgi:hypothetical protein